MQTSLLVPTGLAAVVASLVSWFVLTLLPPKVEVVQRVETRRTVGVLGGSIDSNASQQHCPNGPNKDCPLKVTATVDAQGICHLSVDHLVVHPHKRSRLVWTLPASVTSTGADPTRYNLMFHKGNGIQVLSNVAIGGNPGDANDKLLHPCERTLANPNEFTCTATNANSSTSKHMTKAMAYNIIVWYDTGSFVGGEPNSSSQLCVLDPVIVNRG